MGSWILAEKGEYPRDKTENSCKLHFKIYREDEKIWWNFKLLCVIIITIL
jgi:hypothetical protein